MSDHPPALVAAIRAAAGHVAAQSVETVVVLDAAGTTLYMGSGERDRVSAPVSVLPGSIVVHNHPGDGSLSRQDVRLMLDYQIAQIRAVASDVAYVFDLPSDAAWDEIEDLVTILMDEVRERHREAILDGTMDYEESEHRRWHEIWSGMAEIRNWVYRTESRRVK